MKSDKRHAFLIIAHNEPEVLALLLQSLDHPRVALFVHVDKRAPAIAKQVDTTTMRFATLQRLEPAQAVYWGDVTQVEVELRLFAAARAVAPFAYYHLLSGVDFLLRPVEEVLAFFDANAGKEFVGFWHGEFHENDIFRKIQYRHLFTAYQCRRPDRFLHAITTPPRKWWLIIQKFFHYRRFPHRTFYKGFNWCSITTPFCDLLLSKRQELLRTYRQTLCPDEIYKHTLLAESPFREQVYNFDDAVEGTRRLIDWERGYPYVWKADDLEELSRSHLLFARKVTLDCARLLYQHVHRGAQD